MQRQGYRLFEEEYLPEWKVSSQIYKDGSGRGMEISSKQGHLLRFNFSSMHKTVYLQWVGFSDEIMSGLKDIAKWHPVFWSVKAQDRNEHDCLVCSFNAGDLHLLFKSLDFIATEKPIDEIRGEINNFLNGCDLPIPALVYTR